MIDTSTPKLLAIMIFIIVTFAGAGLFLLEIPTENKDTLYMLIQSLLMAMSAAGGFYWGSSLGSRTKDMKHEEESIPKE